MKALATWSPAPYLNVTAVEREESRWLVTVCSQGASSAPAACDGPDDWPPDLATCGSGTLHKAASPDDRAADCQCRCTQGRLR